MAASALVPVQITRSGTTVTLAAANVDGNYFDNTGKEYLEVNNASVGSINVVFSALADGITVASFKTVAVGAGVRKKIGPFPSSPYNDASNRVNFTYSDVTTVTVAVYYT